MMKINSLFLTLFAFGIIWGCTKEKDPFPVQERTITLEDTALANINPTSIVGLHHFIFKPTCANSGCHDGTFAPDFTTIESSYNTLVYQPIVKNNPSGSYTYRVLPGDANSSVLYRRLIEDIDGQSGIMPLVSDSTWTNFKDEYIENVKTWINNGALDMFGNEPTLANEKPSFLGAMITPQDTISPYPRVAGKALIKVHSQADTVVFYFSFSDDGTSPQSFSENKLKISENKFAFENATEYDLKKHTPVNGPGYVEENVPYTHSAKIDISELPLGTVFYMRTYVKDSNPDITEIPNNESAYYVKDYFSFRRGE